jgi:hypothetical protein
MPKAPRGLHSLPKGGFEQKMSRREAAQIVAIKYNPGNGVGRGANREWAEFLATKVGGAVQDCDVGESS